MSGSFEGIGKTIVGAPASLPSDLNPFARRKPQSNPSNMIGARDDTRDGHISERESLRGDCRCPRSVGYDR